MAKGLGVGVKMVNALNSTILSDASDALNSTIGVFLR